ncbi:MAG: hypothetical protein LBM04_04185 [Opitutaceae bacterium]|nr:hypothetical protein [Opitutaceae bacterium]
MLETAARTVVTQRGTRVQTNRTGTPQGGVISPLLANLYLNSLDHAVNEDPAHDAELVRYADENLMEMIH